jgi:hypothetical protein
MIFRILLILSLFIFSSLSQASIYKCELDGVLSFSQFPCSDDAVEIIVKKSTTTYESDLNKNNFYSETVIDALTQLRLVLIKIQEVKLQKRHFKSQLKTEIVKLNSKANKSLGKFNHQELDDNKVNITASYTQKINHSQNKLDNLIKTKSDLMYKISMQNNILKFDQQFNGNTQAQQINNILKSHKINTQIRKHQDELRLHQVNLNNDLARLKRQSEIANDPQYYKAQSANITKQYNSQITSTYQIINALELERKQYNKF